LFFHISEKLTNFKCRRGSRFGHDTLVDAMLKDGLWDVYNDCAMGMCAELCADNHALTREDQVLTTDSSKCFLF
jgi:acetyl-CoA acetyltransferase